MMKRDGRTLDHQTLETIRLMALERVREGEAPSAVIASYGFSRTTIYKWINAAAKPGLGIKALRSRKASGRPPHLTPRQEQQVFRWVNGHDPREYGLETGLWTRAVVARPDRAQVRHSAWSNGGWRLACQAWSNPAEAAATGLSA
jgi:transposase